MEWFDRLRVRLRLLLDRRGAESRMHDEFRFHIEMEADHLMRAKGLEAVEARRQALVAFGGVEKHKEALREGRGLAWLSGMSLDVRLGGRMLLKYPGLTLAGGLALTIAIGIGAGWYDLTGKLMSPTIPLPDGDRLVVIDTINALTSEPESRVVDDFLEWRTALRSIDDLGAYRTETRNLTVGRATPAPIQVAEITAAAFNAAHVAPLLGRALGDADEVPGAPSVIVLGYDVWQRSLNGRPDVLGSVVRLGETPVTVIGVMPRGFGYPLNHDAWTALSLRDSYAPLEGGAINVIGRLAAGISFDQADAEVRAMGQRAAASFPATHEHLRPGVRRLGAATDLAGATQVASRNLPVLLVLLIACTSVGTLFYARTATREGEIAVRFSLGAGRGRILGQLFVEALVLAAVAAALGLVAADRVLTWGIESVHRASGGAPFWMTPGLQWSTMVYAAGLAIACAALLSLLPALKLTRARLQPYLANRGAGGATLRFGHVWTGAMVVQVALTAIGVPVAMEAANQALLKRSVRAAFPSEGLAVARVGLDRSSDGSIAPSLDATRAHTLTELLRRVEQEPGVMMVTFSDMVPGSATPSRPTEIEASPGARPASGGECRTSAVGLGFFDTLGRPMVAGRAFHGVDLRNQARTVIVNEAYARRLARTSGIGSPLGTRLRYTDPPTQAAVTPVEPWYEIVGVVRDIGLDPDDEGHELPFVFHAASAAAIEPLVMTARVRDDPAALAARLPDMVADVDAGLLVLDARPLGAWVRQRDLDSTMPAAALAAVTLLVLFLSALGIYSLVSVGVSRRTREIGLRTALGAHPRHVLAGILSRATGLMAGGITAGGALLLWALALGAGPSGRPADDVPLFVGYLGMTAAVMLGAALLACVAPASRALRISPSDALKDA